MGVSDPPSDTGTRFVIATVSIVLLPVNVSSCMMVGAAVEIPMHGLAGAGKVVFHHLTPDVIMQFSRVSYHGLSSYLSFCTASAYLPSHT